LASPYGANSRLDVVPRYDAASGTPGGAPRPNLRSMNALAEVLAGRDRVPAWRSASTRRTAILLGWLGFALIAASALIAVIIGSDHQGVAAAAGWLAVGLAVTAAVPLAPRYALLAWRLAFLGVLLTPLIPGQTRADAGFYGVLAIVYAVAAVRYGTRAVWWMAALTLIPIWLWTGPDWTYPARLTVGLVLLAAALHGIVYWRRDRHALERQTAQAERERARSAVLEERARIARELHDVVAHHMSMIAVQAETAPYRLAAAAASATAAGSGAADLPEPVLTEFAAISGAAREALTQMRGLLGVLRAEPTGQGDNSNKRGDRAGIAPDLAPQPGLEDVPGLVDAARRAGAAIDLTMPEDQGPLPPGVGLTAYRIVQESLSNAGRHAPGAAVSVVVRQEPRSVLLKIRNGPSKTPGQPTADGAGHGLVGMRERVALLGGSLEAGPEADGGFTVRATLPAGASP
jgi:signal transduction histidine kinase